MAWRAVLSKLMYGLSRDAISHSLRLAGTRGQVGSLARTRDKHGIACARPTISHDNFRYFQKMTSTGNQQPSSAAAARSGGG
jgi:hypothetical protein